jgi:hypothetical protein
MVTPFGVKKTGLAPGAPAEVDFDRLWQKLFEPLIDSLGYEPVRADADLGASIIVDMIERLALSDLVIADVTLPNANVFYEIGVRHAARATGCVLVAAKWATAPFDTQSMRREPFDLTDGRITDQEALANLTTLAPRVRALAQSKTPCYEMPGFPNLPKERANTLRAWLTSMNAINAKVTAVRLEGDPKVRAEKAMALVAQIGAPSLLHVSVAYELLKLIRDCAGWNQVVQFVDGLSENLRSTPIFVEQRALAVSYSGDPLEAIGLLEGLIALSGETPERQGLIGGRYKKLWRKYRVSSPGQAEKHLNRAIDHYERGRRIDLNEYYAASNLPLLLRSRNGAGDSDRAARIATCVVAACERAIELKTSDEWVYPTLFIAALHAGDVTKARSLAVEVRGEPTVWKLESSLDDIRDAVQLVPDPDVRGLLLEIVASITDSQPTLSQPAFVHP